jgi:hypothetical protein
MTDGVRSDGGAQALPTGPRPPTPNPRAGVAVWLAYLALFVLSVPWYFPAGTGEPFVLGFPLWCLVALACYLLIALLTAWRLDFLWTVATTDARAPRAGASAAGAERARS